MGTEDEEVRGSDFRKAWPNALARAMREAGEITEAMGAHREEADRQRRELSQVAAQLCELVPRAVAVSKEKLDEGTASLASALRQMADQHAVMRADLAACQKQLEQQRDDVDRRRGALVDEKGELAIAQATFARAVAEFSGLRLWERVFLPARLKDIVNKHSRNAT